MYVTRTLESFFRNASNQFPVMLVTGARQVGKTTFLKHLSTENRTYVSLDDPLILNLAKEDPALFFQRFSSPLLIDEIQYAPELLPYIKMDVDQTGEPGRYWLTRSQHFHMMKDVSESLAGRVGIVNLHGLSFRERTSRGSEACVFLPGKKHYMEQLSSTRCLKAGDLFHIIRRGSFPAIALNNQMDWDLFYSSYLQTYLQRDIHDLKNIGDDMRFLRFLRAAAARSGQLLNYTDLARDADVSPNTAKSWLSVLVASGMVYLLEPYHSNITKRLVKTPKLYFLDTGLCSWLTQWNTSEALEAGAFSGPVFETWVVSEILKSWQHNGRKATFYFYRDKDKTEIDLLILNDGILHPFEIKKSASPGKRTVRHFQALEKLNMPVGHGGVICLAQQSIPLTDTITIIPACAVS